MKNLLPDFILENYKNNSFNGSIEAFTMFVDISGFTPMTEKLMKGESEGAEILSDILKNIFRPTVKHVYQFGGFITNFAGDAFTSIFPFNDDKKNIDALAKQVLICADNVIKDFKNSAVQKTVYGNFHLKVKLGLSFGNVEWAIVGENLKSFYFRGEAIQGCAEAQMKAKENELIVDNKFLEVLNNKKIIVEKRGTYYHANNIFENGSVQITNNVNHEISNLAKQIFSKNFFPETIFNVKETGEFRNVVSVFIAFDGNLPKDLVDNLFRITIDSVNHYHGYLKDIDFGDKGGVIVCYFGAPVSYDGDVERALSFIKYAKKKLAYNPNLKSVTIKAGLTLGKVYTGFVGAEERCQYSVIGGAVNLAARFMSNADRNEVWVSEEIFEGAKNKNEFNHIGNLQFKGFSNEISVYKLLEKSAEISKSKDKILIPSKLYETINLVGREKELQALNENVKNILDKKTSGVIYIIGEAGIGKSRLTKEFRTMFSETNKITWLYCYTSEILKRPLSPFKYLLKNFFKQSDSNTTEENKRLFDNIIDIIIKRLEIIIIENKDNTGEAIQIKSELERTRSIVAAMIDIYWANSLYEQLEPELRFENTLFAFSNLVMAECMIQPVIIEIEDIHWLDKDSAEVLKMLLANVSNLPLAIICTSRYLTQSKKTFSEADQQHFKIELSYFTLDHIKNFAEKILNAKVDDKAIEFIFSNTNGNPYFVEQLILDFKEKNIWKKYKNIFTLSDYESLIIPSSINSVLISRFDRLPDKVKEVVQTASVLGREFEFRILQYMLQDDKDLESKLKFAEDEKIWFVADGNKYIFTHALLRDAVYNMQMKTSLKKIHLIASKAYKKFAGKKQSLSTEEHIAYHFGVGHGLVNSKNKLIVDSINVQDDEVKKDIDEYLKLQTSITEKYRNDYSINKAVELYDLMLGLLDKIEDHNKSFFLMLKKVDLLNMISRWKEADLVIEKAFHLANLLKDTNKKMLSIRYFGEVCYYKNEFAKSEKLFKQSLKYFKSKKLFSEVIDIIYNLGHVYHMTGDYKKAWKYYNEHSKIAKRYGNKFQVAESLSATASLLSKTSNSSKVIEYTKNAIEMSRKINFKTNVAKLNQFQGNNYFSIGELEKSRLCFEISLKIFEEIGNRQWAAKILGNIGNIYFVRSDFDEARNYYNKQLKIVNSINDTVGLASVYGSLGILSASLYEYPKALKYYKTQYILNKKLKRNDILGVSLGNIGKLHFDMGQYSKALKNFMSQYKISSSINKINEMLTSLTNLGTAYLSKEDYTKSKIYFDKAVKLINNKFFSFTTFIMLSNYTELLTKIKKYDEALIICKKILEKEKLCSDKGMIILSRIVMEKIKIFIFLNESRNKPSLEKKIEKNIFKNISKIEMFIEDLTEKEYIADAHYYLIEIIFSLKRFNMNHPKEAYFRKNAITLFKDLISSCPVNSYKIQLRKILKNKF
ncbi:MAG: adenylate/guanylate cyclase domain-containing protein [Ignavibacteria bacterium]